MIGMEELEKRINELLKIFKKRAKILASSILDKEGFILATIKDDFIDDDLYEKKIIAFYSAIDSLSKNDIGLIDFDNKRELISVGVVDDFFNNGFMILIQSVADNLKLLAIFPSLLNIRPITSEFDKVINELSRYLIETEDGEVSNNIYKLT